MDPNDQDFPPAGGRDFAAGIEGFVEAMVPEGLDWQDLVRAYPLPALLLAALGGFFLGRQRGPEVVEALSGFAARQVSEGVNDFLGDDVL